jgi:hypothetical protein
MKNDRMLFLGDILWQNKGWDKQTPMIFWTGSTDSNKATRIDIY